MRMLNTGLRQKRAGERKMSDYLKYPQEKRAEVLKKLSRYVRHLE